MIPLNELKKFQKPVEEDDYFTSRIYRKFSIFLSWVFVNIKVNANIVTLLGLILDIITLYFIYNGLWIIAGILVQLFIIWDCVDGEVARYNRNKQKNKEIKNYGAFLDEMLGLMIFYFIILLIGVYTNIYAGIIAAYSMILLNLSAVLATHLFPKKEISKEIQTKIIKNKKIKGKLGFSADIQRTLISLALFFHSSIFLWIYSAGALSLVLIKFYIYRNK